jgi:hypothetical protein
MPISQLDFPMAFPNLSNYSQIGQSDSQTRQKIDIVSEISRYDYVMNVSNEILEIHGVGDATPPLSDLFEVRVRQPDNHSQVMRADSE